ncbi:MAG: hypothetical protein AAGA48_13345 [Myxococcota bacterium]
MHTETTLKVAERFGRFGIWSLLGSGVLFGAAIVPTATAAWLDVLLAVAAAGSIGGAGYLSSALRAVSTLPLAIAPVASRGTSGGHRVYRFRAQLGRGRTVTEPVASVTWQGRDGPPVELDPWVPATTLCGPFTLLARDPDAAVGDEGTFVVRLQVQADGQDWHAEQHIHEIVEGPFEGVEVRRRGVTFTDAWQQVRPPLENADLDGR